MDYNTLTRILLWVLEISFCAELTPLCPVYQTTVYTLLLHSDTVRKIFIKTVFVVNSNDFSCVLLIGQASCAYNKYGIHLELINCMENRLFRRESTYFTKSCIECTIKLRCSMIISTLKLSSYINCLMDSPTRRAEAILRLEIAIHALLPASVTEKMGEQDVTLHRTHTVIIIMMNV